MQQTATQSRIDDKILQYDIFDLTGLNLLDQQSKAGFTQQLLLATTRYFLQELLPERLTHEQLDQIVAKFSHSAATQTSTEQLLAQLQSYLPDANELYLEAAKYVKFQIIKGQYQSRAAFIQSELTKAGDTQKKSQLENELRTCQERVGLVESQQWEELIKPT